MNCRREGEDNVIHWVSIIDYRMVSVQKFGKRMKLNDLAKSRQEDISPCWFPLSYSMPKLMNHGLHNRVVYTRFLFPFTPIFNISLLYLPNLHILCDTFFFFFFCILTICVAAPGWEVLTWRSSTAPSWGWAHGAGVQSGRARSEWFPETRYQPCSHMEHLSLSHTLQLLGPSWEKQKVNQLLISYRYICGIYNSSEQRQEVTQWWLLQREKEYFSSLSLITLPMSISNTLLRSMHVCWQSAKWLS